MNTSKVILLVAALLIGFGLIKPKLNIPNNEPVEVVVEILDAPSDPVLKEKALLVVQCLKAGSNDRVVDGKRLAALYFDLATLIELDGEQTVIKNTEAVRQANALSGPMLRMNIKDKYPDLAKNCNAVIVAAIGEDNIPLTKELRAKASEGFRALSWATNEGSK